jgi:hypothetical protein
MFILKLFCTVRSIIYTLITKNHSIARERAMHSTIAQLYIYVYIMCVFAGTDLERARGSCPLEIFFWPDTFIITYIFGKKKFCFALPEKKIVLLLWLKIWFRIWVCVLISRGTYVFSTVITLLCTVNASHKTRNFC